MQPAPIEQRVNRPNLLGGKRLDRPGYFLQPTILTGITPEDPAFHQESFAPVALIFRVKDEKNAIGLANDSPYGLGGSVITRDVERGKRVAHQIETGMVFYQEGDVDRARSANRRSEKLQLWSVICLAKALSAWQCHFCSSTDGQPAPAYTRLLNDLQSRHVRPVGKPLASIDQPVHGRRSFRQVAPPARCSRPKERKYREKNLVRCARTLWVSGSLKLAAQDPSAQPAAAGSAEVFTDQWIALLRENIRSIKKQLVVANLTLTDSEVTRFWPVYEQYSAEFGKINDTRTAVIKEYADEYGELTDEQADNLIRRRLDTDIAAAQLRQKYVPIFRKVLPGKKAATFFQLDDRIVPQLLPERKVYSTDSRAWGKLMVSLRFTRIESVHGGLSQSTRA
jgi:hypothetical protein